MKNTHESPYRAGNLAKSYIWNLLGIGIPALVGVVATPQLISGLGLERFGILTIVWAVIGYLSFFDFGISRALTKLVAEKVGGQQEEKIPGLVWTALILMTVLALLGGLISALATPWLVDQVLNIPVGLLKETKTSFYLLAATIPMVVLSTGLRGVLEAYQDFDQVNAIRIPLGIITFLGPLLALQFTENLVLAVSILIFSRLLSLAVFIFFVDRRVPKLRERVYFRFPLVKEILSFGGWMTVSNLVSPVLSSADRFLIGSMITMSAVAYYTTPYDVVTKISLISSSLIRVLFPSFAATGAFNPQRTLQLFRISIKFLLLVLFPIALLVLVFAREGLTIWLGEDIAANSTPVAQILILGVFVNGFAQIAYGLIQSIGRPDITAKLIMVEAPIFLAALTWAVNAHGIEGAAAVWSIRNFIETSLLFYIAGRLFPEGKIINYRSLVSVIVVSAAFLVGFIVQSILVKFAFVGLIFCGFFPIVWLIVLSEKERLQVRELIHQFTGLDVH